MSLFNALLRAEPPPPAFPDVDPPSCRLLGPTALVGLFYFGSSAWRLRAVITHIRLRILDSAGTYGSLCDIISYL